MFITQVIFKAYDKDHVEFYLSEEPLSEESLRGKIKGIISTARLQKVIRYSGELISEELYDIHGKRTNP